jgi:hypothetical protein
MTTIYPFTPSNVSLFQFNPTLDGVTYNAVVVWNLFGKRYYLNLSTLTGALVVSIPVIGSPPSTSIASMSWANGFVTVVTAAPHGFLVGATVNVTLAGNAPTAYNGVFPSFIIDPMTFFFPFPSDPGAVSTFGSAQYIANIIGGYFETSVLYFLPSASQFVVSP